MTAAYVLHALRTAFRTARFDGKAAFDYDQSFEGFFRSFFAAILGLPIHILLSAGESRLLADAEAASRDGSATVQAPTGFAYYLADAFLYALDWMAFPIVMIAVTQLIGAGARYVPYIVAYNWGTLVVLLATTPPYLIYLTGALPLSAFVMLYYVSIAFVIAYRWRIARDGLGVSAATASGIVILDLLISAVLMLLAARLMGYS